MKVRLNEAQEKDIANWRNTLGETALLSPEEMARLANKKGFRTNMPRLRKRLTDQVILGFRDANNIFAHLPDGYKRRILQHENWKILSRNLARDEERLNDLEEIDVVMEDVYSSLAKTMKHLPQDLEPSVLALMDPLLTLMEGCLNSANRSAGKPPLKAKRPQSLQTHTESPAGFRT